MMDPAPTPQGADPNPSTASACVDAKRLMPSEPLSKLPQNDNTSSSPTPSTPVEVEDLLQEILLRLPPQPSSLPRASVVCKRWRSILSNPQFLSRFRKHHQKPPLLGFFTVTVSSNKHDFVPILGTKPDCIPAERFPVPKSSNPDQYWRFLGCRHGLAILLNEWSEVVVWDPLTGQQHHIPFPPILLNVTDDKIYWSWHAAVLCADMDDGHVHGDCFSSPFKLVLTCSGHMHSFACLYESASGVWGHIVSTAIPNTVALTKSSILIGNALFWMIWGGSVLVFDIERQSLGVIKKPAGAYAFEPFCYQLLRTDDDSGIGLAVLWNLNIQLWERKSNYDGVVEWVQQKIIPLEGLFPQGMCSIYKKAAIVGYDEDSNVIVLFTTIGEFMLEVESMRFRTISESKVSWFNKVHHPYRNFYTAGREVGWKWVDLEL